MNRVLIIDDDKELEEELKQNENRFLSYVKEKFHQLCKYDHKVFQADFHFF